MKKWNEAVDAYINAIEYYLPEKKLTNDDLVSAYPEWTIEKITKKTGISVRGIAGKNECSSDLALKAAEKLFSSGVCCPSDIDYLLLCTQSPDYFLPTTACLLQDRLGISKTSGALDFNLGCSGYVYGLGLAKGLIETGQVKKVLLLTAETYSKFINKGDRSVRTLFGDAATATLLQGRESDTMQSPAIGPFVYGTDGSGALNLIVPAGGQREPRSGRTARMKEDEDGNIRSLNELYMNGSEIFIFTLDVIPKTVRDILTHSNKTLDDIDLFVFHQANKFMLDHIRKKIKVPEGKFFMSFSKYGNTVSSSIPIALRDALQQGALKSGDLVMLVGFGVGYSWGAALVRWK